MIGQTISHYKILEKLGEGGMGIVYKAHDEKLDRMVALKFLPATVVSSQDEAVRFEREAKAISALNHPGIATIHDIDETDGKKFLVLEYISGGTLKSKLKKLKSDDKEFTVAEVIDYGIQMAEGLGHAHRHQIVHRDVKSDNVMLTEEGKVKITDFGLAKLRSTTHLTRTGSTIGTLAYMAPEQLRGEEIDHRADLFSLGVVLYEMATSRLPFRGEHEAALTYSIANEDPAPVKSLRPNLPPVLEQVITKCLQKDRALRYQSADEIVADLRTLQHETTGTVKTVVVKQQSKLQWMIASALVVVVAVALYLLMPSSHPTSTNSKTIAVLPFVNMSGDPQDEYFSDGMTEDILTQLSKIADLKVISRTSVMKYKHTEKSIREIGNDLNAGVVLEGSVRRAENQIRITAQLIDASTDEHLWAESYDKEFKQIFAVQSDVAQRVADALKIQLMGDEKRSVEKEATQNLEAYNLYLKGRYFLGKRTEDGLKKAIEFFQQAVEKDTAYAIAYAGLADSYTLLALLEFLPPREAFPKAKAAAEKAIMIDPSIAEAHASLGVVRFQYDWDWPAAEQEYTRAIALKKNYGTAHHYYADFLKGMGRFDQALSEIKKAQELDPLSLAINTGLGHVLYLSRHYDQAIEQYRRTLEMDPNFLQARLWFGRPYLQKKMYKEAISELQAAVQLSGNSTIACAMLGHAYAAAGNKKEALKMLDELTKRSEHQYVPSYWIGMIYIGFGDKDKAFAWLDKAYDERSAWLAWLKVEPRFDTLRSDQRFTTLLKKMGLEQ
ncbi:MAG: protein kinase [Ignavibacteria bacterium]|nr:protein kinase [Ignavibacteria bacterium]